MNPQDRYYTMGQFVYDHRSYMIDMDVDMANVIREEAIILANEKDIAIRFKRRHKSGPRNGKTAVQLPRWIWEHVFDKHQKLK